jgi:hypothetical protein
MITQLTYIVARFMLLQSLEAAAACVMLIAQCLMQFFCSIPFWTCGVQQSTIAEYFHPLHKTAHGFMNARCCSNSTAKVLWHDIR